MTNQITHDPTRGWLLLTEKWPEISSFEFFKGSDDYWFDQIGHQKAVAHCLSTAIEIDPKDWEEVFNCISENQLTFKTPPKLIQDHHPYFVDAEFEVVEQYRYKGTDLPWTDCPDHTNPPKFEYRKIARLIKPKQKGIYELASEMSDKERVSISAKELGEFIAKRENKEPESTARLVKAKEEWQPKDPGPAGHFEETESQDESQHALLDELLSYVEKGEPFEKHFRIERI